MRQYGQFSCRASSSSNGASGNGVSVFQSHVDDMVNTSDMGGSDTNVIRELQESDQNPFPKQQDCEGDDPLRKLKNQVSRVVLAVVTAKPASSKRMFGFLTSTRNRV